MSKRKKILLIILLLLAIVVTVRYFQLRRTQETTGEPITYRKFFGLSEKKPSEKEKQEGEYASDFESEEGGTGAGVKGGAPEPQRAEFENTTPINPLGSFSSGSGAGTQTSTFGQGAFSTGTGATPGAQTSPATNQFSSSTELLCDPRDIIIEFTPAELERLQQLELQLLQIAPRLRSTENVENEISNYENFKLYNERIIEYKNFCFEKTARFTTKPKRRPTPFWSDQTLETAGFYSSNKAFQFNAHSDTDPKSYYFIEQYFNMNIW